MEDWSAYDYETDPVLAPIVRRMQEKERRYEEAVRRLQANEQRILQHEQVYRTERAQAQLDQYLQRYPEDRRQEVLDRLERQARVIHTQGLRVEDLDRLAMGEAATTASPGGPQPGAASPPPAASPLPQQMPEVIIPGSRGGDFEQAEEAALQDPEIRHMLASGDLP